MARPYIAIVGNVCTGKSTLACKLSSAWGWRLLPLEQEETNPYRPLLFGNLKDLAFRSLTFYLGWRARHHLESASLGGPLIQEGCLQQMDIELFPRAYLELGAIDNTDLLNLQQMYIVLDKTLPYPDLLVYLHAPTDLLVARAGSRNPARSWLAKALIPVLQSRFDQWVKKQSWAPIITVDTSKLDHVVDDGAFDQVQITIADRLRQLGLL